MANRKPAYFCKEHGVNPNEEVPLQIQSELQDNRSQDGGYPALASLNIADGEDVRMQVGIKEIYDQTLLQKELLVSVALLKI